MVCGGANCAASDSPHILAAFEKEIAARGLTNEAQVLKTGCFGFCDKGPVVKIYPDNVFYAGVKASDVKEIVEEHIVNGRRVERLLYQPDSLQVRRELRNCGIIDPENLEDYIGAHGYEALGECIFNKTQDEIIATVKASGLRGRGGAGFTTGLKWELTKKNVHPGDKAYVVCNADEGDPGAFMNRSVLEGDPHSVLEGMAICGRAVGADEGIIYIRAEYPLAVHRLQLAIQQAEEAGLLGENILGSDFSFKISLSLGAGAFVCGEETALLNSIEGGRGEPRTKPPFPAEKGLFQKPTNINNVGTYSEIPQILLKGAEWYASIGTEKSKGTKVFALAGKINNVGLVEIPFGTTLRDVIFKVGGGIRNGKKFKAVQTGGPSGGFIPESLLDLQIDYETLTGAGSMMGSGSMIVLDENDCMVNMAKFYLEFTMDESCGRCTPCRIGTVRMHELLEKITTGKATMEDLKRLEELGRTICDTALCGLGQSAPNPVLSSLRYFHDEYVEHIEKKHCAAGACKELMEYFITDKCIGCTICAKNCPTKCISGERKALHVIDQERCIKCGVCHAKCPVQAIIKQ